MPEVKKLRDYELLYIVDPDLDEKKIEEVRKEVTSQIESVGEIENEDFWGRRRISFEINKKRDGFWTCLRFKAEPDKIKDVSFELKLNESIMRHMICHPTPPRPEAGE
jgi:small subunit ribosomal protein S6